VIFIDTSALVDSLTGERRSGPKLRRFIDAGEPIAVSAVVLYEWLRGPRTDDELLEQEEIFPRDRSIPFGAAEARRAADLFKRVPRARTKEIDLAIAATALVRDASLWTLNRVDFEDIPGLKLV